MSTDLTLERVKPRQAAKELNIDIDNFYYLMKRGKLPIGYAMKKDGCKRYSFVIYRGLLNAYKKQIQEINQ